MVNNIEIGLHIEVSKVHRLMNQNKQNLLGRIGLVLDSTTLPYNNQIEYLVRFYNVEYTKHYLTAGSYVNLHPWFDTWFKSYYLKTVNFIDVEVNNTSVILRPNKVNIAKISKDINSSNYQDWFSDLSPSEALKTSLGGHPQWELLEVDYTTDILDTVLNKGFNLEVNINPINK